MSDVARQSRPSRTPVALTTIVHTTRAEDREPPIVRMFTSLHERRSKFQVTMGQSMRQGEVVFDTEATKTAVACVEGILGMASYGVSRSGIQLWPADANAWGGTSLIW